VPVVLPYRSDTGCPARPGLNDYCGFYGETHQHGPAATIGEPYIYTVDVTGPEEEIIRTIERAVNTRIEPLCVSSHSLIGVFFIRVRADWTPNSEPEEMKLDSLRRRLLDYFEIDWEEHGKAKALKMKELALPPWLIEWSRRNPDPTLEKAGE
jgi:alpha-1,3(6)-mannosylglycoprotein beta-1,6-N-acetyl-glucosaminyltransferase